MKHDTTLRPETSHVVIHRRPDRFAAWPFNGGLWKYAGDEIVLCYHSRHCAYEHPREVNHNYRPDGYSSPILARSTDGGQTWQEREFHERIGLDDRLRNGEIPKFFDSPLDFSDPDLLIAHYGFVVMMSLDRGRRFSRIGHVPFARFKEIMGRPDYVIRADHACLLFSTVSTSTGVEGRPVVFISRNGAQSWEFLNFMTPEPSYHMQIMPSGALLPDGRIVAAVRVQMEGAAYSLWSEAHVSEDGGCSWRFLSRINDLGAPCHLLLLDDGRLLATYGYRSAPFGIRARLSEDGGASWGPELILRDDGKSWDLGYPKTVQLDNGELFTAYYFNGQDDPVDLDGGVRHIAGTRWRA